MSLDHIRSLLRDGVGGGHGVGGEFKRDDGRVDLLKKIQVQRWLTGEREEAQRPLTTRTLVVP